MTLLRLSRTASTTVPNDPEKRPVHFCEVECPHFPDHGGTAVVHMTPGERFSAPGGWNAWHFEIRRAPLLDDPGVLLVLPSIGLQLVKPHTADCHLGPGELPFKWLDDYEPDSPKST